MIQAFMDFGGISTPEICHGEIAGAWGKPMEIEDQVSNTTNTIDSAIRPEFKLGGRACQCAGCDLWFTGVAPFDRHQLDDENGVYCRTEAEMREIGMTQNKYGVWQWGTSKKRKEAA